MYDSTEQQNCSSKLPKQIKLPHLSVFSPAIPFFWAVHQQQPPLSQLLKLKWSRLVYQHFAATITDSPFPFLSPRYRVTSQINYGIIGPFCCSQHIQCCILLPFEGSSNRVPRFTNHTHFEEIQGKQKATPSPSQSSLNISLARTAKQKSRKCDIREEYSFCLYLKERNSDTLDTSNERDFTESLFPKDKYLCFLMLSFKKIHN